MKYKLLPSLITGYDKLPILRTVSATPYCARAYFCLHLRKPGYQIENHHCIEETNNKQQLPCVSLPYWLRVERCNWWYWWCWSKGWWRWGWKWWLGPFCWWWCSLFTLASWPSWLRSGTIQSRGRIWGRQGFDDSDYSSPQQVGPLDSRWNSPKRGGRPRASLQPACWSGEDSICDDLMGKRSSLDDILVRKKFPNLDVSSIPLDTTDPVANVGLPEQGHLSQVPHLQ